MTHRSLLLKPAFHLTLSFAAACGGELVSAGSGGAGTGTGSGTQGATSGSSSTGSMSAGSMSTGSNSTGSMSTGSTSGSTSSSGSGGAADTTPPTVVFTTPTDMENGVALNANISATFDEPMNVNTLGSSTFMLTQGMSTLAGAISYNGTVATLNPTLNLTSDTDYTVTLTTDVQDLAGNGLAQPHTWTFHTGSGVAQGPAPVSLGTSGGFVILAKSGITTIPQSVVTGNIGVSPIDATAVTGFSLILDGSGTFAKSSQVVGKVFAANYTSPTPSNLTTAILNMQTAYTDAAGRPTPDFTALGGGQLGGLTLVPGLYKWGTNVLISTDVTIAGGPNDVWIFQVGGGITEASNIQIHLTGGALPKNIFWQAAGAVALGTGAHFEGVVLAQTGITLATGATANGRLLSQTAVTLDSATVTQPAP